MIDTVQKDTDLDQVRIGSEDYYKISNVDELRPFLMSVVSDSNHWMFISSNGGLSAGRKNAEHALFPYYTDDKLTESAEHTGSKSIFRVLKNGKSYIWEPFSFRYDGMHEISRNLYKSTYGNKIIFEEINLDLELVFHYQWNSSNEFGFVRTSQLKNTGDIPVQITLVDGIQNIVPAGVGSDLQNQSSNLVDAYKRSELQEETGMGIYALSAIIVDKAEPSEALKANIVWSFGLQEASYLLSSRQLRNFRKGQILHKELDVKAEKGAYFINADIELSPGSTKNWSIVADVNKNHSSIIALLARINGEENLPEKVANDIQLGTTRLLSLIAASDGLQSSADHLRDARHFSNTLFNIMRGGIFDSNYQIEKWDLIDYLTKANKNTIADEIDVLNALAPTFSYFELKSVMAKSENVDFIRLCGEYLPLKFSRRHGDPSRPWNKFSINTRSEIDGSKILDYEGNWRDIFQNWEALAHSYPEFVENMMHKFLNASTFEGYNPYRVTKSGFDWETIEPDNPWSYIGYWGDHQIIYLLKFLEFIEQHSPGKLALYFDQDIFVYANVPYKIKGYTELLENPKDTITFDHQLDLEIRKRVAKIGADGALLQNENGTVHSVNFIEKILATMLSKISNFIPEGGIWMNTQRPEWNDANNALVGNGLSMVTLYYLRRFLRFFQNIISKTTLDNVKVSGELFDFYKRIRLVFEGNKQVLAGRVKDEERKAIMDGLGKAADDYRQHIYKQTFWGPKRSLSMNGLLKFIELSIAFLDHSIKANKRSDNLFHSYNLMSQKNEDEISVSHLSEMLEGQVAILSAGILSAKESLEVLDALKSSTLFREDQYSYLLYPNKALPGFLEKNNIPKHIVENSELLTQLVNDGYSQIIEQDVQGAYHFNGDFNNANDLKAAWNDLFLLDDAQQVYPERKELLAVFESVFNHKAFTGRSGTFYGYEGLGSIYWHMVSKLQVAVQECCLSAISENESHEIVGRLLAHYYEINEGIGVHKSPELYGAFPTDPYSHTPAGKGAQQPGMTGQVKEDILSRFGELGIVVHDGKLSFHPCLLRKDEFVTTERKANYLNIYGEKQQIYLKNGSLCFTYCQIPIIYQISDHSALTVEFTDGRSLQFYNLSLDRETSKYIFERKGLVSQINIQLEQSILR